MAVVIFDTTAAPSAGLRAGDLGWASPNVPAGDSEQTRNAARPQPDRVRQPLRASCGQPTRRLAASSSGTTPAGVILETTAAPSVGVQPI